MSSVREEMNEVAVRILQDWAMMLVESAENTEDFFDSSRSYYVGRLEFKGIVSGTYAVVCQEEFAVALAVNLLGMEDELSDSQKQDAICEMTNVLSGNLLTSSYGEDEVFDLTSPTVTMMDHEKVSELLSGFCLSYRADDNPVCIAFIPERVHHGD